MKTYQLKCGGGRIPALFYLLLRKSFPIIVSPEFAHARSLSHRAYVLGMSRSTYVRMAKFVDRHRDQLDAAQAAGDWTVIEDILFKPSGHYRHMPSFITVSAKIAADPSLHTKSSVKAPEVVVKRPAGAATPPLSSAFPAEAAPNAPVSLDQVQRWIKLGIAAEALLTPLALSRLLSEAPSLEK